MKRQPDPDQLNAEEEKYEAFVALFTSILRLSLASGAASMPSTAPQWHTLATEAYAKKRDDIVFVDAHTGFYGTGKEGKAGS